MDFKYRIPSQKFLLIASILLLISLITCCGAHVKGQQSNGHASVFLGGSSGLGFNNPSFGASGGGDYRSDRFALSGDLSLTRIAKSVGGSGFQVDGRSTVRYYFKDFFVQGGGVVQSYSVTKFGKSTFQPLAGIGFATKDAVIQANYRHDLTSENRQRIVEGKVQVYAARHLYFDARVAVSRFRSGNESLTGSAATFGVGLHF